MVTQRDGDTTTLRISMKRHELNRQQAFAAAATEGLAAWAGHTERRQQLGAPFHDRPAAAPQHGHPLVADKHASLHAGAERLALGDEDAAVADGLGQLPGSCRAAACRGQQRGAGPAARRCQPLLQGAPVGLSRRCRSGVAARSGQRAGSGRGPPQLLGLRSAVAADGRCGICMRNERR